MPGFVVDPLLVTTPSKSSGELELRRWLHALEGWLGEVESSPFAWRHFFECTDALMMLDRFPTFDHLRRIQKLSRLDMNIGLLLRRISAFFQSAEHDLRQSTAIQCAVVEEDAPVILPEDLLQRNETEIRSPMASILLCLACDKSAGQPFARSAHLVSLPFGAGERAATVRGTIALTDPEEIQLPARSIDEAIPVLFSPDDLVQFAHADDLLHAGAAGFSRVIERLARAQSPGAVVLACQIGSEFWKSLLESAIHSDQAAFDKLVRICVAVALNQASDMKVNLRKVRREMAADSPQLHRASDDGRAWRLTITKYGVGWRLHYWHIPAPKPEQPARIEFACVLREQDPVRMPDTE